MINMVPNARNEGGIQNSNVLIYQLVESFLSLVINAGHLT